MILVCGDAMIDEYCFGEVERISPEAPVPVLKVSRYETREGAARNVLANVRALGHEARGLFSDASPKVVKRRMICRNQQLLRVDEDAPQEPITPEAFMQELPSVTCVVFSDYGKGALSRISELIPIAKAAGARVLVDPKGYNYTRYMGADLVKPNLHEMRVLVGGWQSELDLQEKARAVLRVAHIGSLLLTRAQEGMTLYTEVFTERVPAHVEEVYDVTGAGDTAIATLAVCLERGLGAVESCRIANRAAGLVCRKFGTATVTWEELHK